MNELLAKIIEIVDKNKKNYKFFIWVIFAVVLIMVFVPHIYLPFENKIMLKKRLIYFLQYHKSIMKQLRITVICT